MANLRSDCAFADYQSLLVLPHLEDPHSVCRSNKPSLTCSAVLSAPLADERSDDEDEEPSTEAKAKALKGSKAE